MVGAMTNPVWNDSAAARIFRIARRQFVRLAQPGGRSVGAQAIAVSSSGPTYSTKVIRANSETTQIG